MTEGYTQETGEAVKMLTELRNQQVIILWVGTWVCCSLAMVLCFGLLGEGTIYPFATRFEQLIAVSRTACAATALSTFAVWLLTRGYYSIVSMLLRVGLTTFGTFVLYAIAGHEATQWDGPSRFISAIFPSTFFAEYNWFAFILEIAPIESIAATLVLYILLRLGRKIELTNR